MSPLNGHAPTDETKNAQAAMGNNEQLIYWWKMSDDRARRLARNGMAPWLCPCVFPVGVLCAPCLCLSCCDTKNLHCSRIYVLTETELIEYAKADLRINRNGTEEVRYPLEAIVSIWPNADSISIYMPDNAAAFTLYCEEPHAVSKIINLQKNKVIKGWTGDSKQQAATRRIIDIPLHVLASAPAQQHDMTVSLARVSDIASPASANSDRRLSSTTVEDKPHTALSRPRDKNHAADLIAKKAELKKMASSLSKGSITQKEFDTKKVELMKRKKTLDSSG